MKLYLWNNEIEFDEIDLKLKELSAILIKEGKESIAKLVDIGKVKTMGWGIKCWEYPPQEMTRVCKLVGEYIFNFYI